MESLNLYLVLWLVIDCSSLLWWLYPGTSEPFFSLLVWLMGSLFDVPDWIAFAFLEVYL